MDIILIIILFLIFFILILFFLTFGYAFFLAAPYVPIKSEDIKRFLKLAAIKPDQKVYDLGCGDGRLVIASAKKGAIAEGFEISLLPYFLSKTRLFFQRNIKAKIKYKDFWYINLSDADVIYFFLLPKVYSKLQLKFENELKKDTKIITCIWPIEGWQPIIVDIVKGRPNLYLYII